MIHFVYRLHLLVVLLLLFSETTITEAHTSPLSWPSFLCSAPASSPGARPPPRPCGGQRSKGQMCWGGGVWGWGFGMGWGGGVGCVCVHTRTQVTRPRGVAELQPFARLAPCWWTAPPIWKGSCACGCALPVHAGRLRAGWNTARPAKCFRGNLWKCNDMQQTLSRKLATEG